jgi:chorismate-pyruvate lyase
MNTPELGQTAARPRPYAVGEAPEPKLLYPLDEFYRSEGRPLPPVDRARGEDVPEPYHHLLVHDHDMTPTLEAFHGERIHLRLLQRKVEVGALWREVVLTLNDSRRPVEFGAIVIYLDRFPEAAREAILAGRTPLGTILAEHRIEHDSAPRAFLRVEADALIADALATEACEQLYGRRNVLSAPDGSILADILEILPPSDEEHARRPGVVVYR